ncbi:MAG: hypothetical protein ACFE89_12390 [Candidatus Hodarchaeota archaeon]
MPIGDFFVPIGGWLSWGQVFILMLFILILVVMLVNFFFPRKPGQRPSTIAIAIIIITIIFILALVGALSILPP